MKIAIDASRYNSDQPTGVEVYSSFIIPGVLKKIWLNKDFDISLYSPREFQLEGCKSVKYQKKIIPLRRLWTLVRLSLAMFRDKPDLLFVPSHGLPLITPKLTVITIHDVAFKHFRQAYSWFSYWYLCWITKRAVNKATKIIVPSKAVKDDLVKIYRCRKGKIEIIHHGCAELMGKPSSQSNQDNDEKQVVEFFKRYKFNPLTDKFMLFVGRVEEKKNVANIVKAYAKFSQHHPKWRLVLAGKRGIGFKKIWQEVRKHQLEDKVILPGYITEEEKGILSKHCQFFVFPSFYEGFGIPVLSAFFHQKPVILADIPVFKEIAQQAGYFVAPDNPEEISFAMLELAANRKMQKMLVGKGNDRLKLFTWQKSSEKTAKTITELIQSNT